MPTTSLFTNDSAAADTTDPFIEEIDALLSQADSLMDEVQAGLGSEESTSTSTTNQSPQGDPSPVKASFADARPAEPGVEEMAKQLASSADQADTEAIAAVLEADDAAKQAELKHTGDETNDQAPAISPPSTAPEAVPPAAPEASLPAAPDASLPAAPEAAPPAATTSSPAWMTEISDDRVPSVPGLQDGKAQPATREVSAIAIRSRYVKSRLCEIACRVAHLPVDALVLADRPFARLAPRVKTMIGCGAIGTLLIALATWTYGSLRQP